MVYHRSIFSLLWLLSTHHSVVWGDNIRKGSLEQHDRNDEEKGFANFRPLPGDERRDLVAPVTKDYEAAGMRLSTQPRSRSELEHGHFHAQQQALSYISPATKKNGPKVRVRNLSFQSCASGQGAQFVVECVAGSEKHCHQELMAAGVEIVNDLPNSDYFAVCVDTEEEKMLLMKLTDVVNLEEDYARTLSHMPELTKRVDSRQLQGRQQIGYGVEMVKAPEFWAAKQNKGETITVCIIDTGLNVAHEDMDGAIMNGSTSNRVVSDWNEDDAGHGSHVAGIVAARDNLVGIVGVAPEAELYIVRVFEGEDSLFTASSLVAAMDECEKGGADIINLSLGGPNSSSAEKAVVEDLARRGIQVVAASGNSGFASNVQEFPAGYPAVISVGAVDKDRNIADFSTNNDQVDVAAPGVDILSLTESCSSCYGKFSGTSMASPHVAGVFALLMSKYPDKSIAEIREALEESPMDKGACGIDKVYGHGIVDVMAAAAYLDNGGGAAPELAECVEVTVTVGSDKWGSETFYLIKNEAGEIVYRGGPYKNNIETNSEQFSLPSGCYDFFLLDAFGDGNCCENGAGWAKVEINGVEEAYIDDFANGQSAKASFGCSISGGGGESEEDPDAGPVCGNGIVEGSEECDDGNQNDNDNCTNQCTIAVCGDGIVGPGEQCDDGNEIDDDDCRNDCTSGSCGDGIVQAGEECDDGNNDNTDSCTSECKVARCGDGFVQPGEECDDGNDTNGDGCSIVCEIESISTSCAAGEAEVSLFLQSDSYSFNENELYFFEAKGQSSVQDIDFIWAGTQRGIENNKVYEFNECVDASKCYKFYFFDGFGDGLWGSDGLRLRWNQNAVLNIEPFETGEKWEGGPTVYWMQALGNCE